jgi:hypothetical protein
MSRRQLLILPSLALFLLWSSVPAEAASEPQIASKDLTVTLEGGDATKPRLEKDREYGPTTVTVLLRNPTTEAAKVKLWAWLDDGQSIAITRVKGTGIDLMASSRDGVSKLDNRGEFTLRPSSLMPVAVTFEHLTKASSTTGHLALGGPSVTTVSVIGLSLERPTPPWYLWAPLAAGALLAAGLVFARLAALGGLKDTHLPPRQKWTFQDGWASNLAVVGAVVTAVIGAIASLGDTPFGDFAVAKLVGLDVLFVAMVLVAPLTYSALRQTVLVDTQGRHLDQQQDRSQDGDQDRTEVGEHDRIDREHNRTRDEKQDQRQMKTAIAGTVTGLLVAAAAVLWAAFGELATLLILVSAAPHELEEFVLQAGLILLLAGFVVIYAWKTLGWTVEGYAELAQDEEEKKSMLESWLGPDSVGEPAGKHGHIIGI